MINITGYCPMGCGKTLFVGDGGYVTCSLIGCPEPAAVSDILDDRESEHVVNFDENTFTVRHPLRERLEDKLMQCELHDWIWNLDGPPSKPGLYRATAKPKGGWNFTALAGGRMITTATRHLNGEPNRWCQLRKGDVTYCKYTNKPVKQVTK